MADVSVSICRTRSPLSEDAHRINASYGPATAAGPDEPQKPRHDQVLNANGNRGDPDARVAAPLTSNPPTSAVLPPPQESDEAKRLSQASYDSTSSSRSRKNYKSHIGPWQLGRTLGKGSSARVRLCRHNITNQLAAVKIVNRRMAYLVQDSSLAALSKYDSNLPEQNNSEMRVPMAIEREVAILKLIEHPHIMKLYDIWENRSEM
jgi:serine/threonine-protein kinase HSL1, negative regulator of Swe1 kinase